MFVPMFGGAFMYRLTLCLLCNMLVQGAKFNAADKIRANANKLARQNVRITQKQQAAPQTKAMLPKFGGKRTGKTSNSKRSIAGFSKKPIDDTCPMIQLFMRRTETGPWNFFNEIAAEGQLRPLAEDIIDSGGLQAEILRVSLEKGLTMKMFGRDFWVLSGEKSEDNDLFNEDSVERNDNAFDELSPLDERERFDLAYATAVEARKKLVKVAKESSPAFRKVHGRDIQFGYRIQAEGEPIYHIPSHLDILHMASSSSDKQFFWDDGSVWYEPENTPVEPIFMDAILDSTSSVSHQNGNWNRLKNTISRTVISFLSKNQSQSNTLLDPNSKISAGGERGVLEIDCNEGGEDRHGLAFDLYICSDGSAFLQNKKCVRASGGVYAAFVNMDGPRGGQDIGLDAMALHLAEVAGFVSSPFDAELAASIGSIILARHIIHTLTSHSPVGDGNPSAPPKGRITFLTDSKTLCRSLRSGPSSNQFSERSTPSRLASWNFVMEQINAISGMGHSVHTRWIPGHPERRHRSFTEWSFLDGAIWAADLFASEGEISTILPSIDDDKACSRGDEEDMESIEKCKALGLAPDPSFETGGDSTRRGAPNQGNHERSNVVHIGFKEMILCSRTF